MSSLFDQIVESEYTRALVIPVTEVRLESAKIQLFRADVLPAGVKTPIGHCLVAHYVDAGKIDRATKALVVQGSGNTAFAVKEGVDLLGLGVEVVAVVYQSTDPRTVARLKSGGVRVVKQSLRSQGRAGRQGVVNRLLAENKDYVYVEQHEETLIIEIQRRTFGRALAERFGNSLTDFVAGIGTGGTVFGVGQALKPTNRWFQFSGIEGYGSALTLWHHYLRVEKAGFEVKKAVIEKALVHYQKIGVRVKLLIGPISADPNDWFDITLDVPESDQMRGIEGLLGFSEPTELIKKHLLELRRIIFVSDVQAREGVERLKELVIAAGSSAGANYFAALQLARTETDLPSQTILTIVTAKG